MLEKIQKYSLFIIFLFSLGIVLKNKDLGKVDCVLLSFIILVMLIMTDGIYESKLTKEYMKVFDKNEGFRKKKNAKKSTPATAAPVTPVTATQAKAAPATATPATATPATSATKPATATTSAAIISPIQASTTTLPFNTPSVTFSPSTTKPATTKPATTKPATTKPATTQPATTKPATTKPATQPATQPFAQNSDSDILIKKGLYAKYDFLNKLEYQQKDPQYYISSGDLINNSWDNAYSLVDSKHWKPYVSPAPVCVGNDSPCTPCNSGTYMPFLELHNFNKMATK